MLKHSFKTIYQSRFHLSSAVDLKSAVSIAVFLDSDKKSVKTYIDEICTSEKYDKPADEMTTYIHLSSKTKSNIILCSPSKAQAMDVVTQINDFTFMKDKGSAIYSIIKGKDSVVVDIRTKSVPLAEQTIKGLIYGLELASYQFVKALKEQKESPIQISFLFQGKKINDGQKKQIEKYFHEALLVAQSVQTARHLVNLPPNIVNPESLEKIIKSDLGLSKKSKIEVWSYQKCVAEGLGLLTAVGQGAEHLPRLIKISYRPQGNKNKQPIAFVGKGITFDTGGLDIKPSSAMRLMKKDMGGAAAIIGLAKWVDQSQCKQACDFYLAIAENAVDAKSMRPSDVYKSHAGYLVEIDNTDAEGRLVMADAMSVAVSQKEKPSCLIDVSTLTGAIKVGLGADVAGLFSNSESLARQLHEAGQKVGEPNWIMPLVKKYGPSLNSNFADFRNSADGFGGAITAALFLEKFVNDTPWAHFDIYAWTDKAEGCFSQPGGNGQAVLTLIKFLKDRNK